MTTTATVFAFMALSLNAVSYKMSMEKINLTPRVIEFKVRNLHIPKMLPESDAFFVDARLITDKSPVEAYEALKPEKLGTPGGQSWAVVGYISKNVFSQDLIHVRDVIVVDDVLIVNMDYIRHSSKNGEPGNAAFYFKLNIDPIQDKVKTIRFKFNGWRKGRGPILHSLPQNQKVDDLEIVVHS